MIGEDCYDFSNRDLVLIDSVRQLLRKIIQSGTVTRSQLEVLKEIADIFNGLPKTGESLVATICLRGPKRHYGDHEISHHWTIEIEAQSLQVDSGGYFRRPETGGDSFNCMSWYASPGEETEYVDNFHTLNLVDDAMPFELEVAEIDLSEPGYSLDVTFEGEGIEVQVDDETRDEDRENPNGDTDLPAESTVEGTFLSFDNLTQEHEAVTAQLTFLVDLGYGLIALWDGKSTLRFNGWAAEIKKISDDCGRKVSDEQIQWAWNSLAKAPGIPRNSKLESRWKIKKTIFKVFETGEKLVIAVKPQHLAALLGKTSLDKSDLVVVTLLEPLKMRPGKAGRLACCDVKCDVLIRTSDVHDIQREADIMGVDQEQISLGENTVTVTVKSLNKAYTVASRRLEPQRRAHGGRIYDHLLYLPLDGSRVLLEEIRRQVESGEWPEPPEVINSKTENNK